MNASMGIRQRLGLWLAGGSEAVKAVTGQPKLTPYQLLAFVVAGQPIWTNWTVERATREGYRASVWVYRCVREIVESASSVPWVVQRKTAKGWEPVDNHPLQLLLERPNPEMAGSELIELLVAHLQLTGNALLYPVIAGGQARELWPVMPDKVKPIPSDQPGKLLAGYEIDDHGRRERVDRLALVHFKLVDPANPYWGCSPLVAAARTVDTDNEAVAWNKVAMQNRAVTDGVFAFEQPLSREQFEEARRQLREQHQGASNARTPWVLGGGAKWQQMSLSPAEMDFLNSRKFNREEICAAFGVPPPLVGIYDRATFNNIETAKRIFWESTIVRLLDGIRMVLNLRLVQDDELWITYDKSNVPALQESFGAKVDTAYRLFQMGVPFNQINERLELGFEALPGGDVGYLPPNLAPVTGGEGGEVKKASGPTGVKVGDPYGRDVPTKIPTQKGPSGIEIVPNYEPPGIPPYLKPINHNDRDVRQILRGYLNQAEPRLIKWLYSTWTAAAEPLKYQELRNAIVTGDISPAVLAEWQQLYAEFVVSHLQPEWAAAQVSAGSLAAEGLSELTGAKVVFDGGSARAVEWIRTRSGELAVNLSQTQHDAIRVVIGRMREAGVDELSRYLRPVIGLTPKEAGAVLNLRDDLLAQGLDADEVERTVQNYSGFLHRRRALRIARTEMAYSWNFGYQEAVRQARDSGLIRGAYKRWSTADDERTCPICGALDGIAIELDETYPGGTAKVPFTYGPPAHPQCRCALEYMVEVAEHERPEAA